MAKKSDLKTIAVTKDQEIMNSIIDHVSNGGSIIELCKIWQVSYSSVMRTIKACDIFKQRYSEALVERDEWAKERVLLEIRALSTFSIADALQTDGTFKKLTDMPPGLIAAIKEMDANGAIKFVDKLKALDLLGKQLALFTTKHEITGKLSLADLIAKAGEIDEQ